MDSFIEVWNNRSVVKKIHHIFPPSRKILSEFMGFSLLALVSFLCFYLGIQGKLTPGDNVFFLSLHLFILSRIKFSEYYPSLSSHFLRNIQGILLVMTPLAIFSYFVTLFLEGFDPSLYARASYTLAYFYLMSLWVMYAGLCLFGFYFGFSLFFYWSPLVIASFPSYDPPFIVYPGVVMFFLMAWGEWYSYSSFYLSALLEKQDFGEQKAMFKEGAKWALLLSNVFMVLVFIYEKEIARVLVQILFP